MNASMSEAQLKKQWLDSMEHEAQLEEQLDASEKMLDDCRRLRLHELYTRFNVDKLAEVDSLFQRYKGKEKQLFVALRQKYMPTLVEATHRASATSGRNIPDSKTVYKFYKALTEKSSNKFKDTRSDGVKESQTLLIKLEKERQKLEKERQRRAEVEAKLILSESQFQSQRQRNVDIQNDLEKERSKTTDFQRIIADLRNGFEKPMQENETVETQTNTKYTENENETVETQTNTNYTEKENETVETQTDTKYTENVATQVVHEFLPHKFEDFQKLKTKVNTLQKQLKRLEVEKNSLLVRREFDTRQHEIAKRQFEENSRQQLQKAVANQEKRHEQDVQRTLVSLQSCGKNTSLESEVVGILRKANRMTLQILVEQMATQLGRMTHLKEVTEMHIMLLEERQSQAVELHALHTELAEELENISPEFACKPNTVSEHLTIDRNIDPSVSLMDDLAIREASLLAEWGGRRLPSILPNKKNREEEEESKKYPSFVNEHFHKGNQISITNLSPWSTSDEINNIADMDKVIDVGVGGGYHEKHHDKENVNNIYHNPITVELAVKMGRFDRIGWLWKRGAGYMTQDEVDQSWFGGYAPLVPGLHWLHGAQEKRRYCVLRQSRLWYFIEKPDILLMNEIVEASTGIEKGLEKAAIASKVSEWEDASQGSIDLSTVHEAQLGVNGEFLLRTNTRTFTLRADDEAESVQWLRCIQSYVTELRAQRIEKQSIDTIDSSRIDNTNELEQKLQSLQTQKRQILESPEKLEVVPNEMQSDLLSARVAAGDVYAVEIPVHATNCLLSWQFSTVKYDISFSVRFCAGLSDIPKVVSSGSLVKDGEEVLWPLMRVKSQICPQRGMLMSPSRGYFLLIWSNEYSRIRAKELQYRFELSRPAINMLNEQNIENKVKEIQRIPTNFHPERSEEFGMMISTGVSNSEMSTKTSNTQKQMKGSLLSTVGDIGISSVPTGLKSMTDAMSIVTNFFGGKSGKQTNQDDIVTRREEGKNDSTEETLFVKRGSFSLI